MKLSAGSPLVALLASFLTACSNGFDEILFKTVSHPQQPQIRNYAIEPVTFYNPTDGVKISGELTYPKDKNIRAAIVLISGHSAGEPPAKMDYYITGHKYFLTLSHLFTGRGYAVLRFDNRGVGNSSGTYHSATDWDFAADSAAALRWLRNESGISANKVGFVGHSQGGVKAVLASQWEKPDFIVSLAGIGTESLEQTIIRQNREIMQATGKEESDIQRVSRELDDVFVIVKTATDIPAARNGLREYALAAGVQSEAHIQTLVDTYATPWWQSALKMDFNPILKSHQEPILALFASQDLLVSATENHKPTEALLANAKSEVMTFNGLNHLFQTSIEGKGPEEYWKIETTIEPLVVEKIDNWILSL